MMYGPIINREIMKNGVDLILKSSVQAIGFGRSDIISAAGKNAAVVMAIGVSTSENALAKQAGLELGI